MRRKNSIIALITMCAFLLSACATTGRPGEQTRWSSPEECVAAHTVGGAALGALAGVLVGAMSGGEKKVGKGAAIGAASGGVIAFAYAWGSCFAAFTKMQSEQTKGYRETKTEFGYKPQQGTVTKIRDYTIDPAAIAPGDKPTLNASYYVMTPEEKEITVTETLILKIYNPEKQKFEEVGSTYERIVMSPGKRRATSEIQIPPNAEEGKFFIVFKVATEKQTDQMEMPLTITKNQEILAKAKRESARHAKIDKQESTVTVASAKFATTEGSTETNTDKGSKDVIEISGGKQVFITAKTANLRENPDAQSKIIAKAVKDEKYAFVNTVTIAGKQWHQIKLADGKMAWISAAICNLVE